MVKSGVDDATIIQTIRGADAVSFDLSAAGQHDLTSNGVSVKVVTAMKAQAAKNRLPPSTKGSPTRKSLPWSTPVWTRIRS